MARFDRLDLDNPVNLIVYSFVRRLYDGVGEVFGSDRAGPIQQKKSGIREESSCVLKESSAIFEQKDKETCMVVMVV